MFDSSSLKGEKLSALELIATLKTEGTALMAPLHRLEAHQLELEIQNQALRKALSQLEASHGRYVDLYDLAPIAYCTFDRAGVVLDINLTGAAMLGQERARILGQPFLAFVGCEHPEAFLSHIRGSLESAHCVTDEITLSTDQGPLEVQLVSTAANDAHGPAIYCRSALLDITARRLAERATQLTAERLTSAVESELDAFALFDASDHLVLFNSAYRQLIGDSLPGAIVGKSYAELLHAWTNTLAFSDDRERELFVAARLAQRHAPQTAFDVHACDGRRLRVMDRRTPEGGLVKTIWDLTEDMQREEQLKQARATADAANAAKNEFLSSMSHELRTPLNAILGFAQLLELDKKEVLSVRHRERVRHIRNGGEHLLRLIGDILDLSRIEMGGLSMSMEPVSIAELLDEVERTLGPMAAQAGVRMEISEVPDAPMVRVDRTRFAQILLNLGSNAIKYNRPAGSVAFRVSVLSPERVRVTVADTGLGVPLDKQDKLFQPFQRAGQEAGSIQGTGIGLAISKRLTELMGGSVGFRSVQAEGSEFWIELPIHVERDTASARPAPRETVSGIAYDRRGLVLYVEDNPANVRLMRDLLEVFEGIELLTAPTAEIGVELALANSPDVVIMDINLPGMSGLDALRILRGSHQTEHIPVIALTAAASEQERDRGKRLGFCRYVTKPVDVADLEAIIEAALTGGLEAQAKSVAAAPPGRQR